MRRVFTLLVLLLLSVAPAMAQQPVAGATPVQSYQPLYSCDQTQTATGVANTTVTVTIAPQPGKVFYVCSIDINTVANAAVTGAAAPAGVCTTTNLQNNLTWWASNTTQVIGALIPVINLSFGVVPLKTLLPGTAFTIACSGGQSTYNFRANVTGFFGAP